jgi:hypothetical protein
MIAETNTLVDQVQRLVEQGQPPAPAWVVRLLADTERNSGMNAAQAADLRDQLQRITAQAHDLSGQPRDQGYGNRTRTAAELLAIAERRQIEDRQEARHLRDRNDELRKRTETAEAEVARLVARVAGLVEAGNALEAALAPVPFMFGTRLKSISEEEWQKQATVDVAAVNNALAAWREEVPS